MKLVDPSALTELVIPFYGLITSSSAPQHPFDPLKQATHRVRHGPLRSEGDP